MKHHLKLYVLVFVIFALNWSAATVYSASSESNTTGIDMPEISQARHQEPKSKSEIINSFVSEVMKNSSADKELFKATFNNYLFKNEYVRILDDSVDKMLDGGRKNDEIYEIKKDLLNEARKLLETARNKSDAEDIYTFGKEVLIQQWKAGRRELDKLHNRNSKHFLERRRLDSFKEFEISELDEHGNITEIKKMAYEGESMIKFFENFLKMLEKIDSKDDDEVLKKAIRNYLFFDSALINLVAGLNGGRVCTGIITAPYKNHIEDRYLRKMEILRRFKGFMKGKSSTVGVNKIYRLGVRMADKDRERGKLTVPEKIDWLRTVKSKAITKMLKQYE